MVLGAMACALGALFPAPWLGVLMIVELCIELPKPFMETIIATGVPAIVSFAVYYSLAPVSYLEIMEPKGELSKSWEFELEDCLYGFLIGLMCGCLMLVQLVAVGICKQFFIRLKNRCDSTRFLSGKIVAPTVGGLILGKIINFLLLNLFLLKAFYSGRIDLLDSAHDCWGWEHRIRSNYRIYIPGCHLWGQAH